MSVARDRLLEQLQGSLVQAMAEGILVQQAVADRLGLGLSDFKGFTVLLEQGPISAGRLADHTGLTTGAVTRMVDRLERAGWVVRSADHADRRRVIVEPVRERVAEVEPLFAGMSADWVAALEDFDETQLGMLVKLFDRMRETATRLAQTIRQSGGEPD